MSLLYYLFTRHQMRPGEIYSLPEGEKALLLAFAEYEIESRKE